MTDNLSPDKKPKRKPIKVTSTRLVLWVAVAGVGIYSIIQGIIGVSHNG